LKDDRACFRPSLRRAARNGNGGYHPPVLRRLFTLVSALSLLLCVAILAMWCAVAIGHPVHPWKLPKIVQGVGEPEHLPRSYGLYTNSLGFEFQVYDPLGSPIKGPPPHISTMVGSRLRAVPNPAAAQFRAKYPMWGQEVWHFWRFARYNSFVEHQKEGDGGYTLITGRIRWWVIPYLPPVLLTALLPGLRSIGPAKTRMELRRAARGRCRSCGYDLRASPERCPECGRVATVAKANA
jgi:hypothetical protein